MLVTVSISMKSLKTLSSGNSSHFQKYLLRLAQQILNLYQSRNLSNPFIYLFFTFSLDNFTTRVPAVVYLKVLSREHLQFGSSINLHLISQYIIWCNHQDLLIADSLASPFKSPPFIIFLWFELYFMIMATVLSLQN